MEKIKSLILNLETAAMQLDYFTATFHALEMALSYGECVMEKNALYLPLQELLTINKQIKTISDKLCEERTAL